MVGKARWQNKASQHQEKRDDWNKSQKTIAGRIADILKATKAAATRAGIAAQTAPDVISALRDICATTPNARVLICGSLYLAGEILKENG